MNDMIPFLSFQPVHDQVREEIYTAFKEVYDSNWFVLGDRLADFESQYASFNKVKFSVGVGNGLDALFLSLKALNIGVGDEVIVPSNTYIATVLAVSHAGATPVFAEPDADTYNIDPLKIERVITAKTKAIIPVHLYGQACEMEAISRIAHDHALFIVEDNAQSHGAAFKNIMTGAWGDINATSFYPGKNLGGFGDGGAITTNDDQLAAKVRMLRNYGSEKKYYNEVQGYNMRLDELQAAFLSVKLRHLDEWTRQRREIAGWYDHGLAGIADLKLPETCPGATHVYHAYVVCTGKRDELHAHLNRHGVGTLIHYPIPPHLQGAYASLGYNEGDFPIAEKIACTCLSLPIWPGLKETEVAYIVKTIKDFFHA